MPREEKSQSARKEQQPKNMWWMEDTVWFDPWKSKTAVWLGTIYFLAFKKDELDTQVSWILGALKQYHYTEGTSNHYWHIKQFRNPWKIWKRAWHPAKPLKRIGVQIVMCLICSETRCLARSMNTKPRMWKCYPGECFRNSDENTYERLIRSNARWRVSPGTIPPTYSNSPVYEYGEVVYITAQTPSADTLLSLYLKSVNNSYTLLILVSFPTDMCYFPSP